MCEKSHTHTYQLKHIFILWHNGELQHALTAGHVRQKRDKSKNKTSEATFVPVDCYS